MSGVDLSSLSIEELNALIKQAHGEIAKKAKARVVEARAKVAKIAEEYGVGLDDLVVAGKARVAKAKVAPKFRNPKDPSQTWAGRGRKPGWLESALKKGAKLDSFKI